MCLRRSGFFARKTLISWVPFFDCRVHRRGTDSRSDQSHLWPGIGYARFAAVHWFCHSSDTCAPTSPVSIPSPHILPAFLASAIEKARLAVAGMALPSLPAYPSPIFQRILDVLPSVGQFSRKYQFSCDLVQQSDS